MGLIMSGELSGNLAIRGEIPTVPNEDFADSIDFTNIADIMMEPYVVHADIKPLAL